MRLLFTYFFALFISPLFSEPMSISQAENHFFKGEYEKAIEILEALNDVKSEGVHYRLLGLIHNQEYSMDITKINAWADGVVNSEFSVKSAFYSFKKGCSYDDAYSCLLAGEFYGVKKTKMGHNGNLQMSFQKSKIEKAQLKNAVRRYARKALEILEEKEQLSFSDFCAGHTANVILEKEKVNDWRLKCSEGIDNLSGYQKILFRMYSELLD